jgi:RHS repeat-associated protein
LGEAQGFAYQVDGSGKRHAIHDGTQTTWNGSVLSPSNPNTGGVRYTFDPAGRLTHESYPNGRLIVYTFDKVGNRLTRAEQANGTAPVLTTTYTYDGNDRLTQETKPDGSVIQYDYDANGNLTMARNYTASSVYEKRVEYFYTFTGRLAMQRHYSPGSLMAASSVILYNYDGDGNRVSVNRTSYDVSSGQVTGFTANYYQVDATQPFAEVVQEWEQVGTLGSALTLVARYDIGLDRLRMLRLTQPATGPPVWLSSWYAFDGLGSTRSLLDDSGNGTDLWGYGDAFGVPTRLVGSTANAFLFNGQQWDANEELYFLRARYYQAGKGSFIGQDPLLGESENPITLHRYLYSNIDPINFSDPSGLLTSLDISFTSMNQLASGYMRAAGAMFAKRFLQAKLTKAIAVSILSVYAGSIGTGIYGAIESAISNGSGNVDVLREQVASQMMESVRKQILKKSQNNEDGFDYIALGVGEDLERFADLTNARIWYDYPRPPRIPRKGFGDRWWDFDMAVSDPNTVVHVNLDHIGEFNLGTKDPFEGARASARKEYYAGSGGMRRRASGVTNDELFQIATHSEWWYRIIWWKDSIPGQPNSFINGFFQP